MSDQKQEADMDAPDVQVRPVVDFKRIVDALEAAGCEVIEIERDETDDGRPTGLYSVVISPCFKALRINPSGIRIHSPSLTIPDEGAP